MMDVFRPNIRCAGWWRCEESLACSWRLFCQYSCEHPHRQADLLGKRDFLPQALLAGWPLSGRRAAASCQDLGPSSLVTGVMPGDTGPPWWWVEDVGATTVLGGPPRGHLGATRLPGPSGPLPLEHPWEAGDTETTGAQFMPVLGTPPVRGWSENIYYLWENNYTFYLCVRLLDMAPKSEFAAWPDEARATGQFMSRRVSGEHEPPPSPPPAAIYPPYTCTSTVSSSSKLHPD